MILWKNCIAGTTDAGGRSDGSFQNGSDPAPLRNPLASKNSGGDQREYSPLVPRIYDE